MTSGDLVKKLQEVEKDWASKKGPFTFFAVARRTENLASWDILFAADWLKGRGSDTYESIVRDIENKLSLKEKMFIAHIVDLEEDNPIVHDLRTQINIRDHVGACLEFPMHFSHMYAANIEYSPLYILACRGLPGSKSFLKEAPAPGSTPDYS